MASKRMREVMGAMLRGEVRKVAAIKSSVESKTLRRPGMSAPPKFGSMKYSCAICQLAHSRGASGQVFAAASASRPRSPRRPWRRAARRWAADKTAASAKSRLHSRWWRCRWYRTAARCGPARRSRPHSGSSTPARSRGAAPDARRAARNRAPKPAAGCRSSFEIRAVERLRG